MSLRFRRQLRFIPGLHLNLSRSGVSTTVGVPGMRVTLGRRPALDVGLLGSGVSYSKWLGSSAGTAPAAVPGRSVHVLWLWILLTLSRAAWVIRAR